MRYFNKNAQKLVQINEGLIEKINKFNFEKKLNARCNLNHFSIVSITDKTTL
jgi:hypothetical protein